MIFLYHFMGGARNIPNRIGQQGIGLAVAELWLLSLKLPRIIDLCMARRAWSFVRCLMYAVCPDIEETSITSHAVPSVSLPITSAAWLFPFPSLSLCL